MTTRIPPPRVVPDPALPKGEKRVTGPGTAGELTAVYRVPVGGGEEVGRERIRGLVPRVAEPRVVRLGTNPVMTARRVALGAVWDRLTRCEAGGRWSANSGKRSLRWTAVRRPDLAGQRRDGSCRAAPHQASREEQIAVAQKVRDSGGGYGAWPACARKLGLPASGA